MVERRRYALLASNLMCSNNGDGAAACLRDALSHPKIESLLVDVAEKAHARAILHLFPTPALFWAGASPFR